MSRFWPRSMMGQMLLAVAVALLLVQGLGAFLVYKAQSERLEAGLVHTAAFRLVAETRGARFLERFGKHSPRFARRHPAFRLERASSSPLHPGETHDAGTEAALARILADQGLDADEIIVTRRNVADDPFAMERAVRRAAMFGGPPPQMDGQLLIAGVRLAGETGWLVARVRAPPGQAALIWPLLLQTLVIYIVIVGVVALVMRRITRPLATLTSRVEQFAETRDADGQITAEGPDDIRRLIDAHNAMEARISALLDEKDVMLGAIGHDLKTPLAALRVRIESVPDEAERAKMAGTIEDIVHSLDDILSLARVGRPADARERTELSALVSSVVEEYEDLGKPVELGDTQRIVLELRPTWLRRALRNLIDNAVRYGQRARVSLLREGGQATIRIEDDGPGIPETSISSMMEPFTRGEPSRNSGTGGAGLGLALARAIADQHGGKLTLTNRRGANGTIEGLTASLELRIT